MYSHQLTRHWMHGERFSHHDHIFVITVFYIGLLPVSIMLYLIRYIKSKKDGH